VSRVKLFPTLHGFGHLEGGFHSQSLDWYQKNKDTGKHAAQKTETKKALKNSTQQANPDLGNYYDTPSRKWLVLYSYSTDFEHYTCE